jgi:hypothetical protein
MVPTMHMLPHRPAELPRNVPAGLKNGTTKLLRLKINSQRQAPGSPQQQQQQLERGDVTAVGSSSSSAASSQQPPPSLLYSAQVRGAGRDGGSVV